MPVWNRGSKKGNKKAKRCIENSKSFDNQSGLGLNNDVYCFNEKAVEEISPPCLSLDNSSLKAYNSDIFLAQGQCGISSASNAMHSSFYSQSHNKVSLFNGVAIRTQQITNITTGFTNYLRNLSSSLANVANYDKVGSTSITDLTTPEGCHEKNLGLSSLHMTSSAIPYLLATQPNVIDI